MHRSALVNGLLFVPSTVIFVGMSILVIFYSLDSLYTERKDKSVLFWRSLPVTDAETVLSKALTAAIVIPLISFAVIAATQIVSLVLASLWIIFEGGNAMHLIWQPVKLFNVWATTIVGLLALSLWLSPFLGWFLFVSAYAKRMPLLLAALPIIVIPMIEARINMGHLFFNAFFRRTVEPGLINEEHVKNLELSMDLNMSAEVVDPWAALDLSGFLSNPSLWAGLIVCALFTTAAIYVRRYRDESY
jgi:ABC-2 type transport system permease protein